MERSGEQSTLSMTAYMEPGPYDDMVAGLPIAGPLWIKTAPDDDPQGISTPLELEKIKLSEFGGRTLTFIHSVLGDDLYAHDDGKGSEKVSVFTDNKSEATLPVNEYNSGPTEEPGISVTPQSAECKKIIGITTHRRENFGDGMENIASAIKTIAARDDVACIFPVHLNPNVRAVMDKMLGDEPNVAMIEPLDYPHFARLLSISHIMLTDSGGVQEEAPALGKPVLVMRDTTERPEGVTAGTAKLIGTDKNRIVSEIFTLLDDDTAYSAMARAHNPFGDGKASQRIAEIIWNASRQKT